MKPSFLIFTLLMMVIECSASLCEKSESNINPEPLDTTKMTSNKIKITVGSKKNAATRSCR